MYMLGLIYREILTLKQVRAVNIYEYIYIHMVYGQSEDLLYCNTSDRLENVFRCVKLVINIYEKYVVTMLVLDGECGRKRGCLIYLVLSLVNPNKSNEYLAPMCGIGYICFFLGFH